MNSIAIEISDRVWVKVNKEISISGNADLYIPIRNEILNQLRNQLRLQVCFSIVNKTTTVVS